MFGVTIVLLIALTFIVLKTQIGMAMRALSFNPDGRSLMGDEQRHRHLFHLRARLRAGGGGGHSVRRSTIRPSIR